MHRLVYIFLLILTTTSAQAAEVKGWRTAWAASPSEIATPTMALGGKVIEQHVRLTAGGDTIRLRLGHASGIEPLRVNRITVNGIAAKVDGSTEIVIPPRVTLWSDPVVLQVNAGDVLVIRFRIPDREALPTIHWYGNGYGNTQDEQESAVPLPHRVVITAVDVAGGNSIGTLVAIGDSLTDGSTAPPGELGRWPDLLANSLRSAGTYVAIANSGIGGDRLLADAGHTGSSPGILGRLDQGVFTLSAPIAMILLAGTNDIGWPGARLRGQLLAPETALPDAADIISGYRQVIRRAKDRGMFIVLGTIPPMKDRGEVLAGFWSPEKDSIRNEVNSWILNQKESDDVIDFDLALRDPAKPWQLHDALDSGDGIHPNELGYRKMAEAAYAKMHPLLINTK